MPIRIMGILFFIWIGIFNLLVIAQFWGFANDLYTDEAGNADFSSGWIWSYAGSRTGYAHELG